jgi:hypothetical protein
MKIDRQQALQQLELLGYKQGDIVFLTLFYPKGHPLKESDKGVKIETTFPNLPWESLERHQANGRGVYFVVNGQSHAKDDVTEGRVLFYEHDDLKREEDLDQFRKLFPDNPAFEGDAPVVPRDVQMFLWCALELPEPTLQIDTGGKSVHSYWLLEEPLAAHDWIQLQGDLLSFAGADRSLKNPNRVMRLAGCWHTGSDQQTQIVGLTGQRFKATDLRPIIIPKPEQQTRDRSLHDEWKAFDQSFRLPVLESIPLEVFLCRKSEDLIRNGASSERNNAGAALARDLIGTSEFLRESGQRYDGDPYQLFLDYCRRCPSTKGDGWAQKEWDNIWKSAQKGTPGPALPFDLMENRAKGWAWRRYKETLTLPTQKTAETPSEAPQSDFRDRRGEDKEPIDFDTALDYIDGLDHTVEDDIRLEWDCQTYAWSTGLKQRGFTGRRLLEMARARRDATSKIELLDAADILRNEAESRQWTIPGVLPAQTVMVLGAGGGTGKTTLLYGWAKHIATGIEWSGLPVRQGNVLILQSDELKADTKEKLDIIGFWDVPEGRVKVVRGWKITQFRQLERAVEQLKPVLIIVDSVTAIHEGTGVDLNKPEAGDFIYRFNRLAEQADSSIVITHHVNKLGDFRGTSTIHDNSSEPRRLVRPSADDPNAGRNTYYLEIMKSRAGFEVGAKYSLERNPLDYSWEFHGREDSQGAAIREVKKVLDNNQRWLSSKDMAGLIGDSIDRCQITLEECRRFGLAEGEWRFYEGGRFRVYRSIYAQRQPAPAPAVPTQANVIEEVF